MVSIFINWKADVKTNACVVVAGSDEKWTKIWRDVEEMSGKGDLHLLRTALQHREPNKGWIMEMLHIYRVWLVRNTNLQGCMTVFSSMAL